MASFSFSKILAVLLLAGAAWAAEPVHVTVTYYDRANLDPQLWSGARQMVDEIFRRAGIVLDWVDGCGSHDPHGCGSIEVSGVRLAILSRPPEDWSPMAAGVTYRAAGSAPFILISYDRVLKVVSSIAQSGTEADLRRTETVVLAHLISHEFGHALLDTVKHTLSGIMAERMTQQEWRMAGWGSLVFTGEQAATMRARLAAGSGK